MGRTEKFKFICLLSVFLTMPIAQTAHARGELPLDGVTIQDIGGFNSDPRLTMRCRITARDDWGRQSLAALLQTIPPQNRRDWASIVIDSSYRAIDFTIRGHTFRWASSHQRFEANPLLVATSTGVGSLEGKTREEVESQDNQEYVKMKKLFELIDRQCLSLQAAHNQSRDAAAKK
jgi:hypothetical protein